MPELAVRLNRTMHVYQNWKAAWPLTICADLQLCSESECLLDVPSKSPDFFQVVLLGVHERLNELGSQIADFDPCTVTVMRRQQGDANALLPEFSMRRQRKDQAACGSFKSRTFILHSGCRGGHPHQHLFQAQASDLFAHVVCLSHQIQTDVGHKTCFRGGLWGKVGGPPK